MGWKKKDTIVRVSFPHCPHSYPQGCGQVMGRYYSNPIYITQNITKKDGRISKGKRAGLVPLRETVLE